MFKESLTILPATIFEKLARGTADYAPMPTNDEDTLPECDRDTVPMLPLTEPARPPIEEMH